MSEPIAVPGVLEVDADGVVHVGPSAGWPREPWYEVKGEACGSRGKPQLPTVLQRRFPKLTARFAAFTVRPGGNEVSFVDWDSVTVKTPSASAWMEMSPSFVEDSHTTLARHTAADRMVRAMAPWCDVRDLVWLWQQEADRGYAVHELWDGADLGEDSLAFFEEEGLLDLLTEWESALAPATEAAPEALAAAKAVGELAADGVVEVPLLGRVQRLTFPAVRLTTMQGKPGFSLPPFSVVVHLADRPPLPPSPQPPKRKSWFRRLMGS